MQMRMLSLMVGWLLVTIHALAGPLFTVKLDRGVQTEPYTGRVYVVMSTRHSEPRRVMGNWSNPPQIFAMDVKGVPPGDEIVFDESAMSYPNRAAELPAGTYAVQAVARRSLDDWAPGRGVGDACSDPVKVEWPLKSGAVSLHMDRILAAPAFRETDRVRLFEVRSELLSAFHHRPITLRAAVILPRGWAEASTRTWPAIYHIDGFGGELEGARRLAVQEIPDSRRVLIVVPDANNHWGHSVMADSANTGPWGRAFMEELVPAVEKKYKGPAAANGGGGGQRYVTGISSGGWASLWLQVNYPDQFNGCWAHCPDPVDFRDFQRINLYEPGANVYKDAAGNRRPIMRQGEKEPVYFDDFVKREDVLGPGGQIQSFEAVFSGRGADGLPLRLFDRTTGAVNPAVAKSWEAYDIRLLLERGWPGLEPRLKGKIRVYAGSEDDFYLDGAVRLLGETMKKLDPTALVMTVPGMRHQVHDPAFREMYTFVAGHALNKEEAAPAQAPVPTP
jgi:hypothetical protein